MAYREEIPYIEIPSEDDPAKRKDYWEIGKGLQATDGLPTSEYLDQVIEETIAGRYDTATAKEKIKEYYTAMDPSSKDYDTKEGDEVTARIAGILELYSFTFSPITLMDIHRKLFEGIKPDFQPGKWRMKNIRKNEPILNGASVEYSDYGSILTRLQNQFDLEKERQSNYCPPFNEANIKQLSRFISSIWETHGFSDGNTRTVAVFLILYLRNMGYPTNNDYFKAHSDYFRDALVRANYAAAFLGIVPDYRFLEKFFENVLLDAKHDLESLDLRCEELFPEKD